MLLDFNLERMVFLKLNEIFNPERSRAPRSIVTLGL
jgi:hypothetical protein